MEWEPIDDGIITTRIDARIQKITIIQCYAPTNNTETTEKDILIVMGNSNAKVGRNNASIERIMGEEGLGDVNENDKELMDFCALNSFSIGGTLFPHKRVYISTKQLGSLQIG